MYLSPLAFRWNAPPLRGSLLVPTARIKHSHRWPCSNTVCNIHMQGREEHRIGRLRVFILYRPEPEPVSRSRAPRLRIWHWRKHFLIGPVPRLSRQSAGAVMLVLPQQGESMGNNEEPECVISSKSCRPREVERAGPSRNGARGDHQAPVNIPREFDQPPPPCWVANRRFQHLCDCHMLHNPRKK